MPNFNNIPDELRQLRQWVAWTMQKRDGKDTKLPVDPVTHRLAKVNDPTTWGTFDQAVTAGKQLSGIGFVFAADDPYCGIDIDSAPEPEMLKWFDSYTERSWSGRGAHIIIRAKVDQGRHKEHGIFSERRYFVMTGEVIVNRPIREAQAEVDTWLGYNFPEEHKPETDIDLSAFIRPVRQDVIDRIMASNQGGKFARLWAGDASEYGSQSEADAALLSILRFWTGGDKAEAIRLFGCSPFASREKWTRPDYRERTWKKVDHGEVYDQPAPIIMPSPPISPTVVKLRLSPWRNVTAKQVADAISGSALQPLIDYFSAPMTPPLPIQATLLKAMVMAGCALCEKVSGENAFRDATCRGLDLAKVRIMTARGQACNVYGLLVAHSGMGKDIGGISDHLALQHKWMIGNAGSAEGLADILAGDKIERGNGYLAISEFSSWLDKNHWQSKAAAFLTDAFNRGWFSFAMSSRNGTKQRESMFCFPSILAGVQPDTVAKYASLIDLSTGFLSRFIVSRIPDNYYGRPSCRDFSALNQPAVDAIACYRAKEGKVVIHDGYLADTWEMFISHKANMRSHWSRLINEYGPRIALMLSVSNGDMSPEIDIRAEDWEKTSIIVQWFFSMADELFSTIHDDQATSKRERIISRVMRYIEKNPGCTMRDISQGTSSGTTRKERFEAVQELTDRGLIISEPDGKIRPVAKQTEGGMLTC